MKNNIINKFVNKFEKEFEKYDISRLENIKAGFSIRGEYPDSFIGKLGVEHGKEYIPFLYLYLDQNILEKGQFIDGRYINLIVEIKFTLKSNDYFDENRNIYVYNNEFVKNKMHIPINIVSRNNFFFDVNSGEFYKKSKGIYNKITLLEIYKLMNRLHMAQYRDWVGIKTRTRIAILKNIPILFLSLLSATASLFYLVIRGIYFTYDPVMAQLENELQKEIKKPDKKIEKDDIDFFGYKVKSWTLGSYSFLILVAYLLVKNFSISMPFQLGKLFNNSFLIVLMAILTILVFDKVAPSLLRLTIVWLKEKILNINSRKVNIDV